MSSQSNPGPTGTPDFERLVALARGGWRRYALATVLLPLLGLAAAAWGLASGQPLALSAAAPGLLAVALAALLWREAVERRDRVGGLEVLQQEWQEPELDPTARKRLLALIERMFDGRPARPEEAAHG